MGRAKRLESGSRDVGLAIEYVRTRKLVRVLGWVDTEPIPPLEIPVEQLCRGLGIDPREIGVPVQYVLFAGSHGRPGGGLRDLVGTFSSEESAWAAFRALRVNHPSTQGWAELATIDGLGQVNQLAWFGLHSAEEAVEAGGGTGAPRTGTRAAASGPRTARRLAATAEPAAYLKAVTPS